MVSDEIIEGKILLALIFLKRLLIVMFFVLFILLGLVQGADKQIQHLTSIFCKYPTLVIGMKDYII